MLGEQGNGQGTVSPRYPVQITAHADDGSLLSGVQLLIGTKSVGATDTTGSVRLALLGNEGDVASVSVKCPQGYASPEKPIVVGLRHMAEGSPPPRFETVCIPLVRSLVIGVRAENGGHLPIKRLNQVVGETDDYGVAHIYLQAAPHDLITLTLDTGARDNLRPQSPTLQFLAPDRDELVLLEQKFTVQKKVVHVKKPRMPTSL